ncbi:MAG: hypothetical protein B6226_01035 [Candidatus Cloacimonetes bacterium 4572_65]|nr:MAG: hypothetical protein B6226_01035 [Candidatus Cloacimonetes bacterium 4572_65]
MKQFKSLLTRDVLLNKTALSVPLLIVALCYAIITFIALRWGLDIDEMKFDVQGVDFPFVGFVGLNIGIVWLSSILIVISMMIMAPNGLNDNITHKCEIFYRCLPISPWKFVTSKFIIAGIIPMIITLLLAYINVTVSFLFFGSGSDISLGAAFGFVTSAIVLISPYIMLFTAFFLFLSAIIKKKVFSKTFTSVLVLNLVMRLTESLTGRNIGTLTSYVNRWLVNPSCTGKGIIDFEAVSNGFLSKMTLNSGIHEISREIGTSIFSFDGFVLFFTAGLFFVASVYAYKIRKLD